MFRQFILQLLSILLLLVLQFTAIPATHASGLTQNHDTSRVAVTIGLLGHYGFIIPHSREIRDVADANPWGTEVDIGFHFADAKSWQYLQAYPRLGVSLAYYNFDNPEVLGNGYALIAYVELFFSAHKAFSFSFRLGGGLAYLDNVYDPETNPENLFYSTAISFPLEANVMANYRLNRHFMLRAGGTYKHISNAGLRQPNKGINFPTATVGVHYAIQPATFPERQPSESNLQDHKRHYLLALLASYQDRSDDPSRQLPLLGLTAYVSQPVGRLSALTAGAEWVADFTIRKQLEQRGEETDFQRGALLAGHEFRIGRFRFSQQLGVYVYAPHAARDAVYQRYGLEYHTGNKAFFGINLKAHRHVADFLDARIGLRL
ncbi:acyloxyacyl hydrolase [Pontibacter pamirensis]|uniref:acyloxyacyl hydrolase n=1 Tax=Pontibacter pamirensis TaxID=2562824 RepID=UPI001389E14A|nr:acyloxyacyl hydrolase [Pontibacter pamirensis]